MRCSRLKMKIDEDLDEIPDEEDLNSKKNIIATEENPRQRTKNTTSEEIQKVHLSQPCLELSYLCIDSSHDPIQTYPNPF